MKRKQSLIFMALVALTVSFSACYYDKSEEVYPAAPCPITTVSYKSDVVGILSTNCYSCHSTAAAPTNGGGNVLDVYDNLVKFANSGQLLNVIEHVNVPPTLFMPQNGGKLSNCDISKIKAWKDAGAPNN